VTEVEKYCSLLRNGINYGRKKFYSLDPKRAKKDFFVEATNQNWVMQLIGLATPAPRHSGWRHSA
jgi:hypothetical protein